VLISLRREAGPLLDDIKPPPLANRQLLKLTHTVDAISLHKCQLSAVKNASIDVLCRLSRCLSHVTISMLSVALDLAV